MTRVLAFSLPLLGARAMRACLCRFGRCCTMGSGRILRCLLLFQDLLGSQVVVHVLALGSSFPFPKAVSQFPYLLFRRHGYPLHEELMSDDELLSSFCPDFEALFFPLAWSIQFNAAEHLWCPAAGEPPPWRGYRLDGRIVVNSCQGGSQ